ncbi:hypothetical protein P7L95_04035 [Bisgaard Taxon 10/6]|nr:hypothetical protein [Exercitatus varius]MDG2955930.1 hypothetical protein [Exercitatus varius]MDG2964567.1 hypothetical protein [Exercitatus varius]
MLGGKIRRAGEDNVQFFHKYIFIEFRPMGDLLFLCLHKAKVSKKKVHPDFGAVLRLVEIFLRKISKLATLKQTYFPKNFKSLRHLRRGPDERRIVIKVRLIFLIFLNICAYSTSPFCRLKIVKFVENLVCLSVASLQDFRKANFIIFREQGKTGAPFFAYFLWRSKESKN